MHFTLLLPTLISLTTALAAPLRRQNIPDPLRACEIERIYPSTSTCTGAPFPAECADSTRAAASINLSFQKYSIDTVGEQAALLALMLFESEGFKYNKNHFPGRPGQGTKNMQSPSYNLQYATSLFGSERASAAAAKGPEAVLELVSGDEESFGSAAWFLSTQCSAEVRNGLASGSPEGWKQYLEGCVGTTDTEGRDVIWRDALRVMVGQ